MIIFQLSWENVWCDIAFWVKNLINNRTIFTQYTASALRQPDLSTRSSILSVKKLFKSKKDCIDIARYRRCTIYYKLNLWWRHRWFLHLCNVWIFVSCTSYWPFSYLFDYVNGKKQFITEFSVVFFWQNYWFQDKIFLLRDFGIGFNICDWCILYRNWRYFRVKVKIKSCYIYNLK